MYETACLECREGDKLLAVYVGESARSGSERMTEHLENARDKRTDSHIYKHWTNQHGGRQTDFSFKILNFFAAPLERQVGEAVRIARTGASNILNSKSVYNRNPLPRIVAKDVVEPTNLGDMMPECGGSEPSNGDGEDEPVQKSRKQLRRESYRDLMNWGTVVVEEVGGEELDTDSRSNLSLLSEGDEELIDWLNDLKEQDKEDDEAEAQPSQEVQDGRIELVTPANIKRIQTKINSWLKPSGTSCPPPTPIIKT